VLAARSKHDLLRLRPVERAGLQQPCRLADVHDLVERLQAFEERSNPLARQCPCGTIFEFVPLLRTTCRCGLDLEWCAPIGEQSFDVDRAPPLKTWKKPW
jgi:hypothetical protein